MVAPMTPFVSRTPIILLASKSSAEIVSSLVHRCFRSRLRLPRSDHGTLQHRVRLEQELTV
jgi:hypothetical protein